MENKTLSQCLSDAGFSCRTIPVSDHSKLDSGIKMFLEQELKILEAQKRYIENEYYELLQDAYKAGIRKKPIIIDNSKNA